MLPAKWKLEGQLERGAEGTLHYQGMLSTPQVRFAAVKKLFPRAHIEVAKNKVALAKYVHKEETRAKEVVSIPTLFEYQTIIAQKWDAAEYDRRWEYACEHSTASEVANPDDVAMCYLDCLVAEDIESGRRGAEFIAINPMWRSSWKKFWRSIIKRNASLCSDRSGENGERSKDGNISQGEEVSGKAVKADETGCAADCES